MEISRSFIDEFLSSTRPNGLRASSISWAIFNRPVRLTYSGSEDVAYIGPVCARPLCILGWGDIEPIFSTDKDVIVLIPVETQQMAPMNAALLRLKDRSARFAQDGLINLGISGSLQAKEQNLEYSAMLIFPDHIVTSLTRPV